MRRGGQRVPCLHASGYDTNSCILHAKVCSVHCALGYNDFNNLVMQTLWWLPNKILRHIHKKDFPFFEPFPAYLQSKCTKSANKRQKYFFYKNSIWVSKNAEFHADFESVEKVLIKWTQKKLLEKTWRKYALFSLLLMFVKLVLLVTFFCAFFISFFCIFLQKKIFWGHISTFCKLWSQTRKKRLKKSKNVFCKCVLDFNFAPIKGSVFFIF